MGDLTALGNQQWLFFIKQIPVKLYVESADESRSLDRQAVEMKAFVG
jgi:hypothetical protein